jgi:DNA polymerase I-like protein with 3'-5' exonuclease and polymerase domains
MSFVETLGYYANTQQEHLGTTNTLRFKHKKPFCNIPGVDRPKGREIRELIKAPHNHVIIGADMVSLEDTTKRHYIKPLDPAYVAEMEQPGYDPHLDIAKQRGIVTQQEIKAYQAGTGPVERIAEIRKAHKVVNYSAVYGIGARALSKSAGCTLLEAKQMLDTYWERNWAVKEAMETVEKKMVGRHEWVKNPVSQFWYVLRHPKDTFSTINQSTGVYCFDTFVFSLMNKGIQPSLQFHDEVVIMCHKDKVQETLGIMQDCMKETNTKVNLNVELKLDAQVGNNYAEVH